jgi:adenylate kinase
MNFVFLGPPGAGKGTHAHLLAEKFGLAHISTGDLLRAQIKEGSPIGKEAQRYIDNGNLVPDDVVTRMVSERVNQNDAKKGFVLDGYPRTTAQAKALDIVLSDLHRKLDYVINFDTTVKMIIQRLSGRRICPKCGANYNLKNFPPKKQGLCDVDGAQLITRPDDEEKTIHDRLKIYHEKTEPLIEYYKQKGVLVNFDGDEDVDPLQKLLVEMMTGAKR